jgi:hypothetical protein
MIKKITILLSILLIAFIFTGCFEKLPAINSEIFEETYPVESGMSLEVYNFNGSVTISKWDSNTVKVRAEKKTNFGKTELRNVKINVERGTNLVVKSEKLAINPKVSITYDIKIPNFMTLTDIETSNGGIKIEGCKGNVFLRSSNGGIDVFDYEGDINGITSNGGIIAEKVNGNCDLRTSNGGIRVKDIQGFVKLDTSNGGIEAKGIGGIIGIRTSNGKIDVEVSAVQKGGADISTSNGSITAYISRKLNLNIDSSTSNGKIEVKDLEVTPITSSDRILRGKLGSGGDLLTITTSNANIYLMRMD